MIVKEPDYTYKTIVVGDIAVGKSSLISRAANGKFEPQNSTIVVDRFIIDRKFEESEEVCRLEVWDTAGAEAHNSITDQYYRDAQVVLVCFNTCEIKYIV